MRKNLVHGTGQFGTGLAIENKGETTVALSDKRGGYLVKLRFF